MKELEKQIREKQCFLDDTLGKTISLVEDIYSGGPR